MTHQIQIKLQLIKINIKQSIIFSFTTWEGKCRLMHTDVYLPVFYKLLLIILNPLMTQICLLSVIQKCIKDELKHKPVFSF